MPQPWCRWVLQTTLLQGSSVAFARSPSPTAKKKICKRSSDTRRSSSRDILGSRARSTRLRSLPLRFACESLAARLLGYYLVRPRREPRAGLFGGYYASARPPPPDRLVVSCPTALSDSLACLASSLLLPVALSPFFDLHSVSSELCHDDCQAPRVRAPVPSPACEPVPPRSNLLPRHSAPLRCTG